MAEKREFTDFHPVFPDKKRIKCSDCKYRDRTTVELGGKKYEPGITRATCKKFNGNPTYKPDSILFDNDDCIYYEAE